MDVTLDHLKVGMKLRVKHYDERPAFWNPSGLMDKYMGRIVTVYCITNSRNIKIKEDTFWVWRPEDFDYVNCIFTNPVNMKNG